MRSKIGVGIVTCNREDFFKKCYESIPLDKVDELVIVNDGKPYSLVPREGYLIQHKANKGVGISKNDALKYLIEKDCTLLFLIEDDIIIKNPDVFEKYINTAEVSGLWHLMYGYHGPANKINGNINPRTIIDYKDEKVALNQHCVGAFCFYHVNIIKKLGLMDEKFKNAWEHLEHSYRIVNAGLIPAYWWWPDVANSYDYLDELACSEDNSTIRWEDAERKISKTDWQENIQKGAEYFYSVYKCSPTTVPDTPLQGVTERLKQIKKNYSRKILQTQKI